MALQNRSPQLDNRELYRFHIGNECDPKRTSVAVNAYMAIGFTDEMHDLYPWAGQSYQQTAMLSLGDRTANEFRYHNPEQIFRTNCTYQPSRGPTGYYSPQRSAAEDNCQQAFCLSYAE